MTDPAVKIDATATMNILAERIAKLVLAEISAAARPRVGGHRANGARKLKIAVSFDADTFDVIAMRATQEGTSFGEQVRMLVEWGLECANPKELRAEDQSP